jgi:hypothetical protein
MPSRDCLVCLGYEGLLLKLPGVLHLRTLLANLPLSHKGNYVFGASWTRTAVRTLPLPPERRILRIGN